MMYGTIFFVMRALEHEIFWVGLILGVFIRDILLTLQINITCKIHIHMAISGL